jgi:hypothetical protein
MAINPFAGISSQGDTTRVRAAPRTVYPSEVWGHLGWGGDGLRKETAKKDLISSRGDGLVIRE